MMYPNLKFPNVSGRPFFYTNFVSTIDGKIKVTTSQGEKYWPIGSPTDYKTLLELRAYADVLIHGKNTAMSHKTVESIGKQEFKDLRRKSGKKNELLYIVLSRNPDEKLKRQLEHPNVSKTLITNLSVPHLSDKLYKEGHQAILVEGGPHVLGSFLKHGLIDEVFLTIAPKIFGNKNNATLTMVEGHLLSPKKIKKLELLSIKTIENELFLRYKILR